MHPLRSLLGAKGARAFIDDPGWWIHGTCSKENHEPADPARPSSPRKPCFLVPFCPFFPFFPLVPFVEIAHRHPCPGTPLNHPPKRTPMRARIRGLASSPRGPPAQARPATSPSRGVVNHLATTESSVQGLSGYALRLPYSVQFSTFSRAVLPLAPGYPVWFHWCRRPSFILFARDPRWKPDGTRGRTRSGGSLDAPRKLFPHSIQLHSTPLHSTQLLIENGLRYTTTGSKTTDSPKPTDYLTVHSINGPAVCPTNAADQAFPLSTLPTCKNPS